MEGEDESSSLLLAASARRWGQAVARRLAAAADEAAPAGVANARRGARALLVPSHRDGERLSGQRVAAPAAADRRPRHQDAPRGRVDGEVEVACAGRDQRLVDLACAGRAARRLLVDLVVAGGRARAHELVHAILAVLDAVAALGVGNRS